MEVQLMRTYADLQLDWNIDESKRDRARPNRSGHTRAVRNNDAQPMPRRGASLALTVAEACHAVSCFSSVGCVGSTVGSRTRHWTSLGGSVSFRADATDAVP